jgi:glycosyltransferase involved in cell wall biosynthesis
VSDRQPVDNRPSICCVIPCYNVAAHCADVLRMAVSVADEVIAINEGSEDETGGILREAAAENKDRLRVISFVHNRGRGVALLTGFRYAVERLHFDLLIILDGDGQYEAGDVQRFARTFVEEGADIVLGDRTSAKGSMPFWSRVGNRIAAALLRMRYRGRPWDVLCGFRAVSRGFAEEMVSILRGGRFETEIHMLRLALELGKKISRVPLETARPVKPSSSDYRRIADGLRILRALCSFRRRFHPQAQREES